MLGAPGQVGPDEWDRVAGVAHSEGGFATWNGRGARLDAHIPAGREVAASISACGGAPIRWTAKTSATATVAAFAIKEIVVPCPDRDRVLRGHDSSQSWLAMAAALNKAEALLTVSWYSEAGTLSATTPAPAWMCRWPFLSKDVRSMMQESRLPS